MEEATIKNKMTITEGLVELKLLDKRINKEMNISYVAAVKKGTDKINNLKVEEWKTATKAMYQSVNDLIKRRAAIKAAIVLSNATTMVTIAGEEMTRANAIERKSSIEYEKSLLRRIRDSYTLGLSTVERQNMAMETKAENMLDTILRKDRAAKTNQTNAADMEFEQSIIEKFKKENEWELIDPLNCTEEIDALTNRIEEFEKNVDTVLALSNATTFIEI